MAYRQKQAGGGGVSSALAELGEQLGQNGMGSAITPSQAQVVLPDPKLDPNFAEAVFSVTIRHEDGSEENYPLGALTFMEFDLKDDKGKGWKAALPDVKVALPGVFEGEIVTLDTKTQYRVAELQVRRGEAKAAYSRGRVIGK